MSSLIDLPVRERRRNETTILRKALVLLNRIPGVRCTRNNVGKSPCACARCVHFLCPRCRPRLIRPITFGLGNGSPDVVGIYSLPLEGGPVLALAFALEFKAPGARTKREHAEEQAAWMRVAGKRGMACAQVTSEGEAVIAVTEWIATWTRSLSASGSRLSTGA